MAGLRRWISSMKSTSPSARLVRMPARSPLRSSAGPLVTWICAPSSFAMTCARLVFPSPGGPQKRTWSSGSCRACAALTKILRLSRSAAWPTTSSKLRGRSELSKRASSPSCSGSTSRRRVASCIAIYATTRPRLAIRGASQHSPCPLASARTIRQDAKTLRLEPGHRAGERRRVRGGRAYGIGLRDACSASAQPVERRPQQRTPHAPTAPARLDEEAGQRPHLVHVVAGERSRPRQSREFRAAAVRAPADRLGPAESEKPVRLAPHHQRLLPPPCLRAVDLHELLTLAQAPPHAPASGAGAVGAEELFEGRPQIGRQVADLQGQCFCGGALTAFGVGAGHGSRCERRRPRVREGDS